MRVVLRRRRWLAFWPRAIAFLLGVWLAIALPGLSPGLAQTPPPPAEEASQLLQQGFEAFATTRYEAAIEHWEQALALFQQLNSAEGSAIALEGLGMAQQAVGNYDSALDAFQQVLAIAQLQQQVLVEANVLSNLGGVYRILGRYSDALTHLNRSLALWQSLAHRQGEGLVLANLGNVYADLGQIQQATALHQQSLAILQALGDRPGEAVSLNSLGLLESSQGNYEQAQGYYEASLALFRSLEDTRSVGQLLNNLGTVLHLQERPAAALDYYQQSLAVARQLGDRPLESNALTSVGLAYQSLDDYDQALAYQIEGVALAEAQGDRRLLGLALTNLGATQWLAGDSGAAKTTLLAALEQLESIHLALTDPDRVSLFDTQRGAYDVLQQVYVAQGDPERALEVAERGRARALVHLLAERTPDAAAPDRPSGIRPPTLAEIRQVAQDQQATLVQYSTIPDVRFLTQGKRRGNPVKLFIWVVQPTGAIQFKAVDLHALELPLRDMVAGSRHPTGSLTTRQPGQPRISQTAHLQRLYDLLIDPIVSWLPDNPDDRLILIPQDSLLLTPFPALQRADQDSLISHHTLAIAPSIQVLALTHQQRQAQPSLGSWAESPVLVVGNPTMPSVAPAPTKPPVPLASLPGAEAEARAIAQLLNAQPLIGAEATEPTVTTRMASARLIHLATHGLLYYGQPEASSVRDIPGAIALAPSPEADGLLTSSEILNLSLQAELVVLSACDTGRGTITGDGVIGLSRSLMTAGVPSVIVSLWAVPDEPTAYLMTQFYQALQQTPDKTRALRQAMLATRQNYPHPMDWAAFTLIGEAT